MKKTILFVLVLALGQASVSLAAEGAWATRADMPTGRYVLSSSVLDGKIYVIGGARGNPSIPNVEAYDPVTDTWARKANMPMANGAAASSAVNGRIYVIGGRPGLGGVPYSSVIEYNAAADTWTAKTDMPTARSWFSSSVVKGKVYAIGGTRAYKGTPLSTVEEYDPATDTWTSKADMPTPRACVSTSAVNGKIYAFGGTPCRPWFLGLTTVEEYDPATDTWTKKTDMPAGRTYFSTSIVNGKIYVIGGLTTFGGYLSQVEEYDPATDTWTRKADMPTPREGLSTSMVNGKIYAIGGWVGIPISTVEEYDPNPLVVDFNGNGTVDIKDLLRLIEAWGQDEAALDMGPTRFGDGVVDAADLEVLMGYWGQEVDDLTLKACWKLDETKGDVAYDSAAVNDATVMGDALWQPGSGMVDGALLFDGIDDYVKTPFKLNPADGEFSVFAWIKGGAPGQVIISQENGVNWLMAGAQGVLRTDITDPVKVSRRVKKGGLPLISQTTITDGVWHRVGFVWDGTNRILYVDDIEVARDTVDNLLRETDWLNIGVDPDFRPGAFWSELIDDVRIYERVVVP